ncbi:venom protease [Halyomorpha halys]|uniref:venom protease n=1 Tax=Halyomorpha halys TaxID=286706 RepID=UPI0006D4F5CE|nr:venom protease-like [Halyomorpha halys]
MLISFIFFPFIHFVFSQQDVLNTVLQESAIVLINEDKSIGAEIDYTRLGDPTICGYSSKSQRTVAQAGRGVTKIRDWPWMAVLILVADPSIIVCGAAVITRRHLLTAAHCFNDIDKNQLLVRLGEYDFNRATESNKTDYRVEDLRIPNDYYPAAHHNDIAILKLDKTIEYSVYVQPICLPLPQDDYTDTTAVVTGWGQIEYHGQFSKVLLEVSLPIWELKKCRQRYESTIFCTNICAGYEEGERDSCAGDSGGPLMQQRQDGRWTVIGVVSWGRRCAAKQSPGVYTAVNKYLDWIAENTQDVDAQSVYLQDSVIGNALQPPF